jgi:hypothetical protein
MEKEDGGTKKMIIGGTIGRKLNTPPAPYQETTMNRELS